MLDLCKKHFPEEAKRLEGPEGKPERDKTYKHFETIVRAVKDDLVRMRELRNSIYQAILSYYQKCFVLTC